MKSNNVSINKAQGVSSLEDLLSGVEIGLKASRGDKDITAKDLIDPLEFNKNIEYTEFDDTPDGGFEYRGSDTDELVFMDENTNYRRLLDSMDYTDIDAFERWTEGHFMDGQQYRGFKHMSERDQNRTRIYDRILDQATLDKGLVVVRRATPQMLGLDMYDKPTEAQLKRMRGKVIYQAANMSCGVAKQGLTIGDYDGAKSMEYRIHIPGGTKGAGMWVGNEQINGWGSRQREFMTNRDTLYSIGNSKYDADRGVTVVDLYYIGRTKHKY